MTTIGSKDVFFDKRINKWFAQICYNNKQIYLGSFKSKIEAAKAKSFNSTYTLNFPYE